MNKFGVPMDPIEWHAINGFTALNLYDGTGLYLYHVTKDFDETYF